jgi:hypothetical protein
MSKKVGLKINDTIIKRISGPVSLTILEPIEENLPLIMLFGDVHFSNSYLCENCNHSVNCYDIQDNDFLKLFDELARIKNLNIDFNLEHGFDIETEKDYFEYEKQGRLGLFIYKFQECLKKNNNCITKNIKWHYVDAREIKRDFMYNYENSFFIFLRDLVYTKNDIKLQDDKQLFIVDYLFKLCEENNKSEIKRHNYLNNIANIIAILKSKNLNNLFNISNRNKSLIYKQIKKLKYPYDNLTIWKNNLDVYIKYILRKFKQQDINKLIYLFEIYLDISESIFKLKKMKNKLGKDMTDDEYNEEIIYSTIDAYEEELNDIINILQENNIIINILMSISSSLLDIYYITRMLKSPYNSKRVNLSIGFFGEAHNKNIIYFLKDILNKYKIYYNVKEKTIGSDYDRCVMIDKFVDLNELL